MTRERVGVLVLAALAPASMLAFDPGGLYPFGPAKWLVVSTLVPIGAGLVWRRWAVAPTVAVVALVAAMALAAVVGEDGRYAWLGTPERHLGVWTWALVAVAFVAGQSINPVPFEPGTVDPRLLPHGPARSAPPYVVAKGIVVAGLGVGVVGCLEALGSVPDVLDAGHRLGSTFGSAAYLGAAACIVLPIAVGVAWDSRQFHGWRVAAAAAAATTAVAVLGSGARAAWVGLAAALLLVRPRVRGRTAAVAAALLVAVVALTPVGGRIADTFDRDAPGGQGRLDEWRVATRVLADHPLTGVGPEGYRIAFADGVDAAYERAHGRDPLPDRAHNGPLDIALAGGPLGLAAWGAVIVTTAPHLRRARRTGDRTTVGIAAAVVAYLAAQLLLFPLAELEPVVALLAGTLVTTQRNRATPRAATVVVVLVVGAIASAITGTADLRADREADRAVDALRRNDPSTALHHAERAVDLGPGVLRNHLLEAVALEADARGTLAAIEAVDDALELSPGDPIAQRRRAELLVRRAEATLVPDHVAAARRYLDELLDRDPDNGVLQQLAGTAAALAGDQQQADAHWARADDLQNGTG